MESSNIVNWTKLVLIVIIRCVQSADWENMGKVDREGGDPKVAPSKFLQCSFPFYKMYTHTHIHTQPVAFLACGRLEQQFSSCSYSLSHVKEYNYYIYLLAVDEYDLSTQN